ncbi:hypothetical protein [Jiella pacifica]|uniref:Uncharacterized protein n=1 Tax=Jiella pacifica TaxID=2696469 RepID=A0A6N9T218_9HYPH|nr:hypothetical protein [Jiella pacifica]NDW04642.1 hypothetical protein [Jiella pacifica]
MTDRHARNIRGVYRNLGHAREACVRHEIKPTVLYHLVAADRSVVDAVVASFARGERLKVREVKELVAGAAGDGEEGGDAAAAAPGGRGGLKGLKGLAAAKQARQLKSVRAALASIGKEVEAALEPASRGKRVVKGKLAEAVMMTARLAEKELIELVLDIEPDSLSGSQTLRHVRLPETRWQEVLSMLATMAGGAEALRQKGELTPWLTDVVLPLLAFALDGEDGTPSATVARLAAAGADAQPDPEAGPEVGPEEEDEESEERTVLEASTSDATETPTVDAISLVPSRGGAIRSEGESLADRDCNRDHDPLPDADEILDPVEVSAAIAAAAAAAEVVTTAHRAD